MVTDWETWRATFVPDLGGVKSLQVKPEFDHFPYIAYKADTGIGKIEGHVKMSILMGNGYVEVEGRKDGENCDDKQLISSLAMALEGLGAYFNEGHTAPNDKQRSPNILTLHDFADVPVMTDTEQLKWYLIDHNIIHPATPI